MAQKLSPAIPEGVTEIFSNAFEDCDFTEIEIPASVKTVCSEAFLNCASLASVTYHEKTDVERGAFAGCPKKLKKIKTNDTKFSFRVFGTTKYKVRVRAV